MIGRHEQFYRESVRVVMTMCAAKCVRKKTHARTHTHKSTCAA